MENIVNYINQENLVLIPVLYIIGMLLKNFSKFNDKFIPLTLLAIATILSFIIEGTYNAETIGVAVIQGTLITGVAVLSNQILKQMKSDMPILSIAERGNADQKGDGDYIVRNSNNSEEQRGIDYISLAATDSEGGIDVPVRIYLDAGHGGNDPGAVYNGYKEKDLNLEAVTYIGKRLTELGVDVGYSRTTDINPGEVFSRGVRSKGYNYFLSVHCNAGGGTGAEVIVNCKETGAEVQSYYREELSKLGNFRKIYSRKYSNGAIIERAITNGKFNATVNDLDWYGVLRGCWSVGVTGDLLELFFLDNESDLNNYLSKKELFWETIVKSICLTYGIEYNLVSSDDSNTVTVEELKIEMEKLNEIIKQKDNQITVLQNELLAFSPITLYEKSE